jgi:hypothetical protein
MRMKEKKLLPKMTSFLTYLTTRPCLFVSENELIMCRSLPFVHINFVITSLKEKRVNRICSRITGISLRVLFGTRSIRSNTVYMGMEFSNAFGEIVLLRVWLTGHNLKSVPVKAFGFRTTRANQIGLTGSK